MRIIVSEKRRRREKWRKKLEKKDDVDNSNIRKQKHQKGFSSVDVTTKSAVAQLHQWQHQQQQQKQRQQIISSTYLRRSILNFISSQGMKYVLLDKKKTPTCQNCMSIHWSFISSPLSETEIYELDLSRDKCHKPCIVPNVIIDGDYVMFHPRRSSSTCVLLGNSPLPSTGRYYWELYIPSVYGTSIMFGVATKQQKLSSVGFKDLIGSDENGWALSHNGYLWHNGTCKRYMKSLQPLQSALIALHYDSDNDTLSYTINGEHCGIAFKSLKSNNNGLLYPAISSTSAQSVVILGHRCKTCSTLKENCLRKLKRIIVEQDNNQFDLPKHLVQQLDNVR
ncbi:unnamed protein product [Didymodactylos carnosus]|uniref:B30.2/SPRY domain-containing protein n=1 Tax=Didymodactylos carnosus TaxID=1234261 RepID=A0A814X3P9_9BILA|nr:unnamed protein product [Didymodactylos carnosus]CAF1210873.1 unnamed protein product [Didymodactylos carnosus]CAF3873097.1 unnamed protein product [Didymodactylos carnosus]CAF3974880.1 unnamed protein product [Didymodactylos carnosus]